MFDATPSLSPLGISGSFSLGSDDLLAAFALALEAGHEEELRLAFKLFIFWPLVTEAERPEVIADVFELVRKAQEMAQARELKLSASTPVPK